MSHPNSFLILKDNPYTEMVFVKTGKSFMLGEAIDRSRKDNEEGIRISLKRDFYIGAYPVTLGFWEKIMGSDDPSHFSEKIRAVEEVSWWDICGNPDYETATEEGWKTSIKNSFLYKLKNHKGIAAVLKNGTFDLPSEAQWEYAARGGIEATERFKYAGSNDLDEVAWHSKNCQGKIKPVGQKSENELGLYDMSGNVWEWCRDYVHLKHKDKKEFAQSDYCFVSSDKTVDRMIRGGSWNSSPSFCRIAVRRSHRSRYKGIGFRLVFFPN